MVDEALFSSRLSRLKTSLELEERHLKETGDEVEDKESEGLVEELALLARRTVNPELVKEFETCLTNADKLYKETQKGLIEQEISLTRHKDTLRELVKDDPSPK